ncbi:hypothetical protein Mal4_52660 [Maioricimonas rarisocia]|uniref:Uncharacterized protein n=1 Tax=Maioricimonas rarisocia TaxID=2528026 RepID=A0A517ZEG9_9PLAN|nr:hypothetical protein Mal4_52660 [Maioricimonas rarisocia]
MSRLVWILSVASMLVGGMHGRPSCVLSEGDANRVRGLGDPQYECEECYYSTGTMQCTGDATIPDNVCRQIADPPVQGATCGGECLGTIWCSGENLKGYCSQSGIVPFTLCDCTENGTMVCGVKMVAAGACNETWGQPPGGGPLEFLHCECGRIIPTQVECNDSDVDELNTSCPGGGVMVYSFPRGFNRTSLLASIR